MSVYLMKTMHELPFISYTTTTSDAPYCSYFLIHTIARTHTHTHAHNVQRGIPQLRYLGMGEYRSGHHLLWLELRRGQEVTGR